MATAKHTAAVAALRACDAYAEALLRYKKHPTNETQDAMLRSRTAAELAIGTFSSTAFTALNAYLHVCCREVMTKVMVAQEDLQYGVSVNKTKCGFDEEHFS